MRIGAIGAARPAMIFSLLPILLSWGCASGDLLRGGTWPGVGATRSGPEAGCPMIMSHFEDWYSNYGMRERRASGDSPMNVPHSGIDFDVVEGTPVLAAAPGGVTPIMYEWNDTPIAMVLYHGQDSDGKYIFTMYTHLSKQLKKPGNRVARGEVIGLSGKTGTPDPHLHLGLWRTPVGPGPQFQKYLQKVFREADRSILADPALHWADPKRPGFYPRQTYPERPIRLTYPLPCEGPK